VTFVTLPLWCGCYRFPLVTLLFFFYVVAVDGNQADPNSGVIK
jgi:hypothetical protein